MILKSITLNGFKSFGKKTVIDLSRNVTGIVGPNGSGKSNISEAIRFVMGEQSMKSIRSRSNADLIFKGSTYTSALSRASVSVEIDNRDKGAISAASQDLAKFLAYDEIVLSREVYSDGGSVYKINNAEVRLKDVQELLALAGIGASTHTIISQGEADQVLVASSQDRKEIIEDALGLRVHHIRLKESAKKLKKVEDNIKIVEIQRKEIAPEISHLNLQMAKIKRVEEEKVTLLENYKKYFKVESEIIMEHNEKIKNYKDKESQLEILRNNLAELKAKESSLENTFEEKQDEKDALRDEKQQLEKEILAISFEKKRFLEKIAEAQKNIYIENGAFRNILSLFNILNESIDAKNIDETAKNFIILKDEIYKYGNAADTAELNTKIAALDEQDKNLRAKVTQLQDRIAQQKQSPHQSLRELQNIYKDKTKIEQEISTIESEKVSHVAFVQNLIRREGDLNFSISEASKLVGAKVLEYKNTEVDTKSHNHEEIKRKIDRSKIRIEEIGIIDGLDIKREYEEVVARDQFLEKELSDLRATRESVEKLIVELKETISKDFKEGVEKINFHFANLFNEIFPGGKAKIFLTENINNNSEEDASDLSAQAGLQENSYEDGVEIEISLPEKKIKDLNMLSGGEKTLCSISLLFALTAILPPPFMVLDETDAALDEMNAKKYGKLLQKLAKNSRLLVITHNRETMNECDTLYGVTMGGDGVSKVLSIKFD